MSDKKNGKGTTKGKGSKAVKSVAKKPAVKKAAAKKSSGSIATYCFDATAQLRVKVVQIAQDFRSVSTADVEARPGDVIEWRSDSGEDFYIRFDRTGQKTAEANGLRFILSRGGVASMVVRKLGNGERRPKANYDIVSPYGTLDPKVIIDPMAQ